MSKILFLDSGYSSLKAIYNGTPVKIPTSISFASNIGINIGDSNKVYEFEGHQYVVGESADEESFATTDFKFKHQFEPLIIKNYRDHLGISDDEVPTVVLSLALIDWVNKDEFIKRCSEFTVNGKVIRNNIQLIPQGYGAYADFVANKTNAEHPSTTFLIDIGYNTINIMYFENGNPVRSKCKGYPNHGVSSIMKPFTNYMETRFNLPFSEQEALNIFRSGKFKYQGTVVPEVAEKILQLKKEFVIKLFNSVLVADKKLLSTSEVVILSGGGCYFLEEVGFPPNVKMVDAPYEYSNVRGMSI